MVEAPRIRLIYRSIKKFTNYIIKHAAGTSYKNLTDLTGYNIKKIWFAGKYFYIGLKNNNSDTIILRIHFMMYGKILIDKEHDGSAKVKPNLILDLGSNILYFYFSQIKIVNKDCIKKSIEYMPLDISHYKYDPNKLFDHVKKAIKSYSDTDTILPDFLLDQDVFPGVGNILQQEALYKCKLSPILTIGDLSDTNIACLINKLHETAMSMYKLDRIDAPYTDRFKLYEIYHRGYCPLGHKTTTKYLGKKNRRTTWCSTCQQI